MKKYIKANSDKVFETFQCEGIWVRFAMHETPLDTLTNVNDYQADVDEIHPYDLQEYVWARIGSRGKMLAIFVDPDKNGRIVDRMQLELYNPDIDYRGMGKIKREKTPNPVYQPLFDIEADEEENQYAYIDYCLTLVAQRMRDLNKNTSSRIDHT